MNARTAQQDQSRRRDMQLIHVARRELAMDDDTYRAMLELVAGVRSSSDLDGAGRTKVLDHMKKKGFTVKSKGASAGKAGDAAKQAADPQYRKIQALWSALARAGAVRVNTEAALRVYIKRITGVDSYIFCTNVQVTCIIETLKKWIDRVEAAASHVASNDPGVDDE